MTVVEGETAFFPCEYSGTATLPSWMINGEPLAHTSPHKDYRYNRSGLIIPQVTAQMNGVSVFCFFELGLKLFRSKTGYLSVVDNIIMTGKTNNPLQGGYLNHY